MAGGAAAVEAAAAGRRRLSAGRRPREGVPIGRSYGLAALGVALGLAAARWPLADRHSSAAFAATGAAGRPVVTQALSLQLAPPSGPGELGARARRLSLGALGGEEAAGAGGVAAEAAAGAPRVLFLHPRSGRPGFVEVPNVGDAAGEGEGKPEWPAVAEQLARRVAWDLGDPPAVDFEVMDTSEYCEDFIKNENSAYTFDFVFGVDLPDEEWADCLQAVEQAAAQRLFISSAADREVAPCWRALTHVQGASGQDLEDVGPLGLKAELGGWALAAKTRKEVVELWHRRTAEEAVYAVLLLIDSLVTPLASMRAQKPVPTLETLTRAIGGCQEEFRQCFTTPRCLQSLACLTTCGLADQSCSYRCIVSYQSEAFTQFSLCALQKQNLLNSQIERPVTPNALPIESFRGQPLTFDVANDILVGHYNPDTGHRHSWLVAAGSNPAYEQFALQYQLWYRGSARGSFWYHPTFLVEALDGRKIWRSRDYRVRRTDRPGVWEFSVLDNGIISEEKWHLLGAADDLSWLVLFYIGAARKAGLSYRGCLVLTEDGQLPSGPDATAAVARAIARAGMRMWELEATSNPPIDPLNPPPLIAPETQPASPLLQVPVAA